MVLTRICVGPHIPRGFLRPSSLPIQDLQPVVPKQLPKTLTHLGICRYQSLVRKHQVSEIHTNSWLAQSPNRPTTSHLHCPQVLYKYIWGSVIVEYRLSERSVVLLRCGVQ